VNRSALRALLWLTAFVLVLAGTLLGDARFGVAAALFVIGALGLFAPRGVRPAIAAVALGALVAFLCGGTALLIDLFPALIAGLVGWLFARTLLPPRRPLIARAIAAIDGEDWLQQPAVARDALRHTRLRAGVPTGRQRLGAASALHARGFFSPLPLPSPRLFAAAILPAVVAAVFLLEFATRRIWLPQVPRHGLVAFLRRLAAAWPSLLE
jgi:hypothetical protein